MKGSPAGGAADANALSMLNAAVPVSVFVPADWDGVKGGFCVGRKLVPVPSWNDEIAKPARITVLPPRNVGLQAKPSLGSKSSPPFVAGYSPVGNPLVPTTPVGTGVLPGNCSAPVKIFTFT